jgi:hypothetical protein
VAPLDEVAVRVNMVVAVRVADPDPVTGKAPVPLVCCTAGEMVTDAAFVVTQLIVAVWPLFTVAGVALKFVIWGVVDGGLFEPLEPPVPVVLHPIICKTVSRTKQILILWKYV